MSPFWRIFLASLPQNHLCCQQTFICQRTTWDVVSRDFLDLPNIDSYISYWDSSSSSKDQICPNDQRDEWDSCQSGAKEAKHANTFWIMMAGSWRRIRKIMYTHLLTELSPTGPIRAICRMLEQSDAVHRFLEFHTCLISRWSRYGMQEAEMIWVKWETAETQTPSSNRSPGIDHVQC